MLRLLGKISVGLVVGIVLLALAATGYRSWRQHVAETALAITSPNGIDEQMYVEVHGAQQWITLRGQNRSNPVLLVVHGGPGVALSPLATAFLAYERDYTVVQWDQPGAARTLSRAGGTIRRDLTLAGIAADGIAIAEFVREHLANDELILVGLSWGSAVGIEMARARPDLFAAYVGTGLFVNKRDGESHGYAETLARARAKGNDRAVEELVAIGPPPYDTPGEARTQRRWAVDLTGQPSAADAAIERLGALLTAPRYGLADVRGYFDGYLASDAQFDLGIVDLRKNGLAFGLPFFVFQGSDDVATPPGLARAYFDRITAPRSAFVTIDGGGHDSLTEEPEQFLAALNEHVRPLAMQDRKGR